MAEAAAFFAERQVRGEVVLVVEGAPAAGPVSDEAIDDAVRQQLDLGLGYGPRQIADVVAGALGVPRRKAYEAVLRLRGDGEGRTER
jgi:16S rRNA (cytidine1402-2'-O)-methyltransferase